MVKQDNLPLTPLEVSWTMSPKLIHLRSTHTEAHYVLTRNSENTQLYRDIVASAPVEFGNQMGCLLPPSIRLVRSDRLRTAADVSEQIFELALVDHYAKRVVYYNKVIALLNEPDLGAKPLAQSLVWRTPDPAYKSVISGISERVFTEYLLEYYQVIMSDSQQTGQGPFFWERQILVALSNHIYVYYYQTGAPLLHISDRESFERLQNALRDHPNDHMQNFAVISKQPLPAHPTFQIAEAIS